MSKQPTPPDASALALAHRTYKSEVRLKKAIAANIKQYRLAAGMTQRELAQLTNRRQANVSRMERGMSRSNIHSLHSIAIALNTTVSDLTRVPSDD